MATIDPIHCKQMLLNDLKLKRYVEKTDQYDLEILQLETDIDFYHYGIKA